MNATFLMLLQLHRSAMTAVERRRNANPVVPRTLYPIATEEVYADSIRETQKAFVVSVYSALDRKLSSIMDSADRPNRSDGLSDDYEKLQDELNEILLALYGASYASSPKMQSLLRNVSTKLKGFHEATVARQTAAVAGTPYNPGIADWEAVRAEWELTNYSLIKNLSAEYIAKINTTILTGVQAGWTMEEMADALQTISEKITGWRSNLIARDQVGKLSNKILKSLYTGLGMDSYLWNTARDERVRGDPKGRYPKAIPSHWEMMSVVCNWKDSTVYSDDAGQTWKKRTATMPQVEPGMEIACRCLPGPMFLPMIQYVDNKINGGI